MKLTGNVHINYAPILAVVFSACCWLGIYALYANFAQRGLELMQRSGLMSSVEGAVLLGLYAMGLVLLSACGLGAIAALIKFAVHGNGPGHATKVDRPL
jgi:hypothetical protein